MEDKINTNLNTASKDSDKPNAANEDVQVDASRIDETAGDGIVDTTTVNQRGTEDIDNTHVSVGATTSVDEEDEDNEREEAYRQIVENARVTVVPPATGKASHPRAFADYFHAKRNKTKIIDFPSWDSPHQSPEYNLYVAKTELLKVTHQLHFARQEDATKRDVLSQEARKIEQKQAEFSQLIVDTDPFVEKNKEIRARFERSIARNEAKERSLREDTEVLRDASGKFELWERLMRVLVEKYGPYQRFVQTCLEQSGEQQHDISSLMTTYVSKLYAKYELLSQLYRDVHTIDVTKHDLGVKMSSHGETVKQLTDQVSDLRARVRELTGQKSLLEKERGLIVEEKERTSYEWSEVQKSLDNAYKLFILDAQPLPGHKKPGVKEKNATTIETKSNEEKVTELQMQYDYLTQVVKVATRLHESSDDTLRAHVSMDTIDLSM